MVLEIMISGLVAFVKDSCKVNDAQKLRIVLVDGHMEPHRAKLKIAFDSLAEDQVSAQPDDKELELGNKVVWVWYLNNEVIKFDNPPDIKIFEGHRKKDGDDYIEPKPKPETDPSDDLSWAPEIHRACGIPVEQAYPRDEVKDDTKFTYETRDGVVKFAVARFAALTIEQSNKPPSKAKKNQLSAVIGELSENKDPKVFKFATPKYKQAVADKARLTLKLKNSPSSKSVEIHLVNPTTNEERTIYLKDDDTSVDVVNAPTTKQIETYPATLGHFHEYLKLLKTESIKCPVPEEEVLSGESGQSENPVFVKSAHPVKCTICVDCGPG